MTLYLDKQFEIRKILRNIMKDNVDEDVGKILDDEPEVYIEDNTEYDKLNNMIEGHKEPEELEELEELKELEELEELEEPEEPEELEEPEEPEELEELKELKELKEPEDSVVDLKEAMEEIKEIREENEENFQVDADFDICMVDFIKQVNNTELEYFFKLKTNTINQEKVVKQIQSFRATIVDELYDSIQSSLKERGIKKRVSKKDLAKVDEKIYNRNSNIVAYLHNMSMLILLTNNTFTLQQNKNILYNINNETLLNINIKRFISELTKTKGIQRVIKEYEQELKINTNIICLSLIIALFNIIKKTNVNAPDIEYNYSNLKRIKKLLEECSEQSEGEKIIYIENDEIFFFDDKVLASAFSAGDYINHHNNKRFDDEFIKHLTSKVGKCQTCDVDITDDKYKSIYMARDKPLLVHFCSLDCFTKLKWKQGDFKS